jgi:hypothetical protein
LRVFSFGIYCLFALAFPVPTLAQIFLPLNNTLHELALCRENGTFHEQIKPFRLSDVPSIDTSLNFSSKSKHRGQDIFDLTVYPLLDISGGSESGKSDMPFRTEAGAGFTLIPGDRRFSLNANVSASWFRPLGYVDSVVRVSGFEPGFGRAFGDSSGYSSAYADFAAVFAPKKHLSFALGRGKHFWGPGFRSLFLSDAAPAYPYFNFRGEVWKLKYSFLLSMHTDATHPSQMKADFNRKYAVSHFLSWNATPKWNFSFFETVIWQGSDSLRNRNFDVNYINPFIFFRPVEFSLGSSDNVLMGFSFKHKPCRWFQWYGQFLIDEFLLKEIKADVGEFFFPDDANDSGWWANKYGIQVGWKAPNAFTLKNLVLQQEFNTVRPFTYAHGSVQQNYGHSGMALAHPLGANFYEWVHTLTYLYKKFQVEGFWGSASVGRDSSGINFGSNIFRSYASRYSEYGNLTAQGLKTKIKNGAIRVSWLLQKNYGLYADLGFRYREERNPHATQITRFFFAGIHTTLWNRNTEF